MSEIDYVIPGIVVEKEGIVDISDLYKLMRNWLEKRDYSVVEKEYVDEVAEKSSISIKWEGEKDVDDYTRFIIKVGIKGKVENVRLKKKNAVKGVISIKFESCMEQDYEEKWENSPVFKFFRGIFDKYGMKNRFNKYSKELRENTYDLYYEVKAYLGLLKTVEK
ncbi:MAG: hypothetical protein KKG60_01795 [Nanoarchaeota archaeon]|nr:hypothetical protein [Nanoarchaeota archaeon]